MPPALLEDVSHVIQLSIAPVFLLTAVGTFINVMSTRLARIVDRARVLRERQTQGDAAARAEVVSELHVLARRRRLVNVAITSAVTSALLVCLLIAVAFVGSIFGVHLALLLAVLFIAAMLALVGALVWFLREIFLAVRSVAIEAK